VYVVATRGLCASMDGLDEESCSDYDDDGDDMYIGEQGAG
jgi:hypothetical protein